MTANAASVIECAVLSGAPSVPAIAETALGMLAPSGEAPPLPALLRVDPLIVLRMLRASEALDLLNGQSASRRIGAVAEAGGQALLRAAMLDTHQWSMRHRGVPEGFRRYWSHSLLTAETARELALRCGQTDPEDAFIAGLLLDVALPLLSAEPRYLNLFGQGHSEAALNALESIELGTSHGELGAELMPRAWAGDLADAVRFHHNDAVLFDDAPELLRVARAAEEMSGGGVGDAVQHIALAHALTGLPMERLHDAWQAACQRTVVQLAALRLGDPAVPMTAGEPYRPHFETLAEDAPQPPALLDLARGGLLAQVFEPGADSDVLNIYRLAGALLLDLPMPQMLLPEQGVQGVPGAQGDMCFAAADAAGGVGAARLDLSHPGLDDIGRHLRSGVPWYCEDARQAARLPVSMQRLLRSVRGEVCLLLPLTSEAGLEALALYRLPAFAVPGLRSRAAGLQALAAAAARALCMQRAHARELAELRHSMVEQYAAHSRQMRADLNTPLGLLKHQVKSMRLKMGADSMFESELSVFSDQVIRIDTVLHQFESRPPDVAAAVQWTDINPLIEQLMAEIDERTFRVRGITSELHLDSALPPLHLPLAAMRDILEALLAVSAEQVGSGGRIAISSADGVNWNGALHAEIRIRDFGRGMDAARVAALFASSIAEGRARPVLSHALSQIRGLGGSLSCKSAIGQGTVFQLLLPRLTRRRTPGAAQQAS